MDLLQLLPCLRVFDRILVGYGGITPVQILTTVSLFSNVVFLDFTLLYSGPE